MTVLVKHSTPADSSFSTTGATAWNADHTLTGVGTMAEQNANNVAITGGAIDGTTVGATTASTGIFTTVTSTVATGTAPFSVASTTPVANLSIGGNAATATNVAYSGLTGTVPTWNQNTTGTASNVTGTVAIGNGGTGQTTKTAAFDALSPATTKGDLIAYDGTDNIRIPVGTDTYVLTADSTQASGIKWAVGGSGSGTVTSVSGTGTVNGLTLTGTVTSSGNLTLGGTLNLSSPPAIGGTTPAAISATTLSLTGTTDQVSSVAVSSIPSAPSAGNLKTFARTIAGGYTAPAFLNATNTVSMMQSSFGFKKIIQGTVNGAATNYVFVPATAIGNTTSVGTSTAISSTNTSFYTRINKFSQVSLATAGSFSSVVLNSNNIQILTLGVPGTPNVGGFLWVYSFGIGDTVASPRTFVGLSTATAAATNVEPSTLINVIGVGQGASNTNLFVYYGGSAAQTPIDLGASFPTNTSSTDWYQVVLYAPPTSNNTVYYQVTRQNTGAVASGTLTGTAGTALPANTSNLFYRGWRTNNATASAVTLQYGLMYIETDY